MTELPADCTGRYGYMGTRDVEFLRWAANSPLDGALLNIGCYRGLSCSVLATIAGTMNRGPLVCVDPFLEAYGQSVLAPDPPAPYEEWDANMRACNVRQFILHFRQRSGEALPKLLERGMSFRLIFVDGSHDERDVLEDMRNSWPLLRPGGLLVLDDWVGFEGVKRAAIQARGDRWAPCGDKMAYTLKV